MSCADTQNMPIEKVRELNLTSNVGFKSLPDQLVNKSIQQGFSFNILCIGETGIGKSVLMDTLFNTQFESTPSSHNLPGVSVKTNTYDLEETYVRLKLTIVNSVGFGDQIDKTDSYQPIIEYIDSQFDSYLQEELKVKRSLHSYHDTRIHCCLYFITPTGHSLKSLDLVTMKALDSKVNIIPIIAKADTITKAELHKFKLKIIGELVANSVKIYQFPTDDENVAEINNSMNKFLPFAVVGSMDEVKVGNKFVKARQYPWGTVQVENESHCDFVRLREMLIRQNMQDLVDNTHSRHYELYRRSKLQEMGFNDNDNMSMRDAYDIKRKEHLEELKVQEDERKKMFICRVRDKESELKLAENNMKQKFEQFNREEDNELKRMRAKQKELEEEMNVYKMKKNSTSNILKKKK